MRHSSFPTQTLLGRIITYRPLDYAILIGQTVIFYAVELLPGLLMQRIFDLLANTRSLPSEVWLLLAVLAGSLLARWGTIPLWFTAEGRLITTAGTLMRRNMLTHVMSQPGARALPGSAGEAVSRFRDDIQGVLSFVGLLPDMPMQLLTLIIMFVILARTNSVLALVAVVPIVISLAAAQLAGTLIRRRRRETQDAIGAVTGSLGEIFGAAQAIKLAGSEANVTRAFERIGELRRKALLRITLLLQLLQSLSYNSAALATAAVLIAAVVTGDVLAMQPGELALFVTYFSSMNFLVGFFGELLNNYRQTDVNLRRMSEVLIGAPPTALTEHHQIYLNGEPPSDPTPPLHAPLQDLEIDAIGYRYPGAESGIDACSFRLKRGELTVITGRVGAGKTTLLRALLGLLPAKGTVRWNGDIVEKRDAFFRPPHSAYVPQTPRLFSDTVRDNILMGQDHAGLDDAIRLAVFEHDVAEFEQGLATPVGVRGTKVSGGQLQRTAAARAFVRQPELIVVDDLSSALDVETETLLWQRVFEQTGKRTILAVSHRRAALDRADHIVVMREGRILDQGPLAALLERCDEMRAIYQNEST